MAYSCVVSQHTDPGGIWLILNNETHVQYIFVPQCGTIALLYMSFPADAAERLLFYFIL